MTKINDAVYAKRCVYNLHYHLIWCTKYRNEIFTTLGLINDMKETLQKVADDNDIIIEKLEVMPDHVHTMVSFPPKKSVVDVVKALKGRSAFIFLKSHPQITKDKCWGGHLWSSSYYIGSLGNMSKSVVEKYINNQRYNKKNK
ncbi:transposase [Apilactobacillus ozensis DSM 23829 = JCM 17196]|uniref:Transposase n=1 Tax=Apilactobacillus ozensis DSM 23829 = JCM 17196 TaxID=1423781 RepID=A0A0R2AMS5_9LACO|nr:IS200/IS605 family transposase [Apilactobacillus ozensis]KRM68167.1 transposase [Apilactobacillus ozensis DSM 23829 = JCM 17196]